MAAMRAGAQQQLKQALTALEELLLVTPTTSTLLPASIEDFIQQRGLHDWRAQDAEPRTALLTELFSFPLTLASFANQQQQQPIKTINLIGARAEATLPDIYWLQLFHCVPALDKQPVIKFIGLDVYPFLKNKTVHMDGDAGRSLTREYHPGPYFESTPADLTVFFNPGFASYQNSWKSAVQQVAAHQKESAFAWVTGFNQVDAERDAQFVSELLLKDKDKNNEVELLPVRENAFASRKEHAEGTSGRVARANHFAWAWRQRRK